jgi:UDP-glucuronate 4-epimerase
MKVLITGVAGFIGSQVAKALLKRGDIVVGIDNLNDYYDVSLKEARLDDVQSYANPDQFVFTKGDIADRDTIYGLFEREKPQRVINLAAQAGVRYSLENPLAYVESNLVGFAHILEASRKLGVEHLVFASSSSVYGANGAMPFSVHDNVDHPLSLYAATKKSNELMAHSYAHLYGIPMTGLRFFTVYGPWGRPDMALFKFTKAILGNQLIEVFNYGKHSRDFTFIDDIVEGVVRVLDMQANSNKDWDEKKPDPATSASPWVIYNIGNQKPTKLMDYIKVLEECLDRKASLKMLPRQPGDVESTWADVTELDEAVGYRPCTTIQEGVKKFVEWYIEFYGY